MRPSTDSYISAHTQSYRYAEAYIDGDSDFGADNHTNSESESHSNPRSSRHIRANADVDSYPITYAYPDYDTGPSYPQEWMHGPSWERRHS